MGSMTSGRGSTSGPSWGRSRSWCFNERMFGGFEMSRSDFLELLWGGDNLRFHFFNSLL